MAKTWHYERYILASTNEFNDKFSLVSAPERNHEQRNLSQRPPGHLASI